MATPASRPWGWSDFARDLALVVGAIVLAGLTGALEDRRDLAAAILVAGPLVLRQRFPIPVLLVVALTSVASATHTSTPVIQVAAVATASFSVGERASDRFRNASGILLVAAFMGFGFLAQDASPLEAIVLPFVVLVPAWIVGDLIRSRGLEAAARAEAEERRLRETESRLAAAAVEERRHMARELHDVVAHGVSVMLIQAGAARQVLDSSPEQAREALLNVEAAGRESMAELRRMLGTLNDDGEAAPIAPQPGVDQLEELVKRVREAGLPTELTIDGTPQPLPASLDVTVYRIVQEALTNALRYAKRAATLVRLSFEPGQLRVEILDDGPAATSGAVEGSGRGLVGLQERASQVGGRVEAGPRLGGGYAVRAWLPLDAPVP